MKWLCKFVKKDNKQKLRFRREKLKCVLLNEKMQNALFNEEKMQNYTFWAEAHIQKAKFETNTLF